MKNLEKYNVSAISNKEQLETFGGKVPWNPIFLAIYIIDEIYEGWTRECTSSCNHL